MAYLLYTLLMSCRISVIHRALITSGKAEILFSSSVFHYTDLHLSNILCFRMGRYFVLNYAIIFGNTV